MGVMLDVSSVGRYLGDEFVHIHTDQIIVTERSAQTLVRTSAERICKSFFSDAKGNF